MCVCYVTTLYFSYNVRWREFLPRRWWLPKKEVSAKGITYTSSSPGGLLSIPHDGH